MSAQEFEKQDDELMGMVNGHAAPEAIADAEEIMERATAPAPVTDQTDLQETEDSYHISKKRFAEMEAEVKKSLRMKTIAAVIVCALMAVSLLMVLAKPALLIWLVNIGIATCAVITGIAVDRWCRR